MALSSHLKNSIFYYKIKILTKKEVYPLAIQYKVFNTEQIEYSLYITQKKIQIQYKLYLLKSRPRLNQERNFKLLIRQYIVISTL